MNYYCDHCKIMYYCYNDYLKHKCEKGLWKK